jgi:hypothetical protein
LSAAGRGVRLGAALFFVLLATTCALAVVVVRSRSPDLVLEVCAPNPDKAFVFSPKATDGPTDAQLRFFVRESDPAASIAVVDAHEDVVRTLDESRALEAEEPVEYVWDGRSDAGAFVPDGRYRLRVDLPDSDREMIWPRRLVFSSDPAEAIEPGQEEC